MNNDRKGQFEHVVPLRWSDLDVQVHVNNLRIASCLEEGRAFFLASVCDHDYLSEPRHVVRRLEVDYLAPLRITDSPVVVRIAVEHIGRTSFVLWEQATTMNGVVIAVGRTVMVAWDAAAAAAREVDGALRRRLAAYSAGSASSPAGAGI